MSHGIREWSSLLFWGITSPASLQAEARRLSLIHQATSRPATPPSLAASDGNTNTGTGIPGRYRGLDVKGPATVDYGISEDAVLADVQASARLVSQATGTHARCSPSHDAAIGTHVATDVADSTAAITLLRALDGSVRARDGELEALAAALDVSVDSFE